MSSTRSRAKGRFDITLEAGLFQNKSPLFHMNMFFWMKTPTRFMFPQSEAREKATGMTAYTSLSLSLPICSTGMKRVLSPHSLLERQMGRSAHPGAPRTLLLLT